jgi:uncharacterized protein
VRKWYRSFFVCLMAILLLLPLGVHAAAEPFDRNHYIYDDANLLTDKEKTDLQSLAAKLGAERETAFIILTVDGTDGRELKKYVEDFYDKNGPGYDQQFGNTAIAAIDMQERDVYLAGFEKAEQYLDDSRLNMIRDQITPYLSSGDYFQAFSEFITEAHQYMGIEPDSGTGYVPGDNSGGYTGTDMVDEPIGNGQDFTLESLFFKWWVQLIIALAVGGISVGVMAYRSGGRVTVNASTYMDEERSGVLNKHDHLIRQTITRVKKPENNTRSGGGGGISSGGHTHSGSSGKF